LVRVNTLTKIYKRDLIIKCYHNFHSGVQQSHTKSHTVHIESRNRDLI